MLSRLVKKTLTPQISDGMMKRDKKNNSVLTPDKEEGDDMTTIEIDNEKKTIVMYRGEEKECNLSPEHANQLVFTGVYRANPDDFADFPNITRYWDVSGKYHCTNWVFSPTIYHDGRVFMKDNYWSIGDSNKTFELTDENWDDMFPRFQLVMDDKKNYRTVGYDDVCLYDPDDIVEATFGSGGWTCGNTMWVRRDAEKVPRRVLAKNIKSAKSEISKVLYTAPLSMALRDLERTLAEMEERGDMLDDSDELAERDELLAGFGTLELTLGQLGGGDFGRWLQDDAYCPGEIYDASGVFYRIFSADDKVRLLTAVECLANGEDPDSEDAKIVYREFAYVEDADCIVCVMSDEERALSAVRFDATVNNLMQVRDNAAGKPALLDEYSPYHNNAQAREVLEQAQKLLDAMDELRKAKENW